MAVKMYFKRLDLLMQEESAACKEEVVSTIDSISESLKKKMRELKSLVDVFYTGGEDIESHMRHTAYVNMQPEGTRGVLYANCIKMLCREAVHACQPLQKSLYNSVDNQFKALDARIHLIFRDAVRFIKSNLTLPVLTQGLGSAEVAIRCWSNPKILAEQDPKHMAQTAVSIAFSIRSDMCTEQNLAAEGWSKVKRQALDIMKQRVDQALVTAKNDLLSEISTYERNLKTLSMFLVQEALVAVHERSDQWTEDVFVSDLSDALVRAVQTHMSLVERFNPLMTLKWLRSVTGRQASSAGGLSGAQDSMSSDAPDRLVNEFEKMNRSMTEETQSLWNDFTKKFLSGSPSKEKTPSDAASTGSSATPMPGTSSPSASSDSDSSPGRKRSPKRKAATNAPSHGMTTRSSKAPRV